LFHGTLHFLQHALRRNALSWAISRQCAWDATGNEKMQREMRLYITGCSFSNRVSYDDRLTWCDARCLTRCHLASVSDSCHFFRTSQTCTCGGYTSCSCRRAHACSSGTVFVTVTVDRGRCADQLDRRRGYARPAVGSRPRSRENMVAVNADALVRLTRAVLPAISPTPLRYRLPLWSPTTATAIADRPARAHSS
jgi:hypothetical protein